MWASRGGQGRRLRTWQWYTVFCSIPHPHPLPRYMSGIVNRAVEPSPTPAGKVESAEGALKCPITHFRSGSCCVLGGTKTATKTNFRMAHCRRVSRRRLAVGQPPAKRHGLCIGGDLPGVVVSVCDRIRYQWACCHQICAPALMSVYYCAVCQKNNPYCQLRDGVCDCVQAVALLAFGDGRGCGDRPNCARLSFTAKGGG